jgi:hypothetical protein
VAHAGTVLAVWVLSLHGSGLALSAQVWILFAWSWLVWPLLLAVHPARSRLRFAVPVVFGVAILTPCVQPIFAFTAWSIGGIAP